MCERGKIESCTQDLLLAFKQVAERSGRGLELDKQLGANTTISLALERVRPVFNKISPISLAVMSRTGKWPIDAMNVLDEVLSVSEDAKEADGPKRLIFSHSSDFDENGLIYFIGTDHGLKTTFTNPHDSGKITVGGSNLSTGSLSGLVGRDSCQRYTTNGLNSEMTIDLGEKWTIVLSAYTVRHGYATNTHCLRNWDLLGSEDGNKWVTVKSHKNDSGLNGGYGIHTWKVTTDASYRHFKFLLTGTESNGSLYLMISAVELYGTATFFDP